MAKLNAPVDITTVRAGFTDPVQGPPTTEQAAPTTVEPSTGETVQQRRRGRPPGSTNRPRISVSGIETLLLGIHSTLYATFGVPEFQLDKEEAKLVADAYSEVAAHYPMLNFDPKYAALANMAGVISIVYGSRLASLRMRAMTNKKRAQPAPANVAPANVQPSPQMNGAEMPMPPSEPEPQPVTEQMRTAHIEGVGNVVFPPDHPLVSGKKH